MSKNLHEELLDNGLLYDHYLVLLNIYDDIPLSKHKRIQGFINLLHKKGYLTDNILTNKALILLDQKSDSSKKLNIEEFSNNLHLKCQQKLIELTGKKQIVSLNKGTKYSFLCNKEDLCTQLKKVIKHYKLTDFKQIEDAILTYIEHKNTSKWWFPLLYYYIFKNGKSDLVTDLENNTKEEIPIKEELKNTKELFG